MPRFIVTITQTETRVYEVEADHEESAVQQAQEWNEDPTGVTPEGCRRYQYNFDSETQVSNA